MTVSTVFSPLRDSDVFRLIRVVVMHREFAKPGNGNMSFNVRQDKSGRPWRSKCGTQMQRMDLESLHRERNLCVVQPDLVSAASCTVRNFPEVSATRVGRGRQEKVAW